MLSPRNDIHPSSKKTKTKPNTKSNDKSASSFFGFKRGFLNHTNSSSIMPSSSCAATATATTMMTTTSPSPTFPTTHAFSSNADYDTPQVAAAAAVAEPTLPPSIPDPQNEDECVLCCYPFPLKENGSCYKSCCGELICQGCIIAQKRTLIIGTDVKKPIAGSKEEDLEFITILESAEQMMVCPFCRAKSPTNDKE